MPSHHCRRARAAWASSVNHGPEPLPELRPGSHGWLCELPACFLGQPVELRIDTRLVPAAHPPPPPESTELRLARLILGGLSEVLAGCERRYRERYAAYPALINAVASPRVWVCREMPGRETPEDWALVIGVKGDLDWGTHAEFRGLDFLGMWSGD